MVRVRCYYRKSYGSQKKSRERAGHNIQWLLFIGYLYLVANSNSIKCLLSHFISLVLGD